MSDASRQYDLAVIGAGINGAGIARDAAMRGLSVIALDKGDMCNATSAISSRLIHGGLRYLEYGEVPLVYESLHERRYLRRIASHLVKPLRICIPIYTGAKRGRLLIRLGMIAYDLLSWNKKLPRHDMLNRDAIIARERGLSSGGLVAAACYYDAQVNFAERLVLENLLAARAAGADIRTYSKVVDIATSQGAVKELTFEDTLTGARQTGGVRCVVNAAGPWVDNVLDSTGQTFPRFIGGTKGSHIIVGAFDGSPNDAFYVEAESDGRPFFIIPWYGLYLIGTTDIRYDDSLDEIRASGAEVDYLIAETNRVFPSANLSKADVHYAYAGVRPLPRQTEGPESAITRKHIIHSHGGEIRRLFSIIGGKLTTYRNLAEQTVDKVGKALDRKLPECRTHDTVLPGAWGIDTAADTVVAVEGLSAIGRQRLLDVYGGRAASIVELARQRPELSECIDNDNRILAAEVSFVVDEEMPRTLTDVVHRRMMVGLDADQGRPYYARIAELIASELGWDAGRTAAELDALRAYSDSLRVS